MAIKTEEERELAIRTEVVPQFLHCGVVELVYLSVDARI